MGGWSKSPDTEALRTKTGVRDLKPLSEKWKRHENSRSRLDCAVKLSVLGKLGFAQRLMKATGYRRSSVLDKVVVHRLPASSNVRWNFHSCPINTVFEHREDLIRFESIQDSGDIDPITAGAFAMLLEDQGFKFFLQLFHHIMPHVDLLYAKLQKKVIDSVYIQDSIQQFQQDIQKIR
ncbi:hypothetical protein MHYP_G00364030 [Metynnis hypsauchen]